MKKILIIFSVLLIVAVCTIAIPQSLCGGFYMGTTDTATIFTRNVLVTPLASFHSHVGRYPTTEEGIAALFSAPRAVESTWKGPYVSGDRLPLDPWGREYQYRSPALKSKTGYDVWSLGPDGVPSADDIGNWKN